MRSLIDHVRSAIHMVPAPPGWLVTASVATIVCVLHAASVISPEIPLRDAAQNVGIGVHLARTGSFGLGPSEPFTMYREPVYPGVVALQVIIDPRLRDLLGGGAVDGAAAIALKQQNLLWAAVLLLSVAALIARLSTSIPGRLEAVLPAMGVIVVHVTMLASRDVMDRTLTELPAAAMATLSSLLGVMVVDAALRGSGRRGPVPRGAALGAALAVLTLIKASFLYIVPVYLIVLWIAVRIRRRASTRKGPAGGGLRAPSVGVGILAALLSFTVLTTPWVARNEVRFGEPSVAGRSGVVLWYRAVKNTMTPAEHRAAWVVYSPGPLRGAVAAALGVDVSDVSETSALRRVDRFAFFYPQEPVDHSFYRRARDDRARLTRAFSASGVETWTEANLRADATLRAWALEAIAEDPAATLRTAPLFLWRGTWPMLSSEVLPPALLGPFNPVAMAAIILGTMLGLLRGRIRVLAATLLPFGAVVSFSLFTHFEGRFSLPMVPAGLAVAIAGVGVLAAGIAARSTVRVRPPRSADPSIRGGA